MKNYSALNNYHYDTKPTFLKRLDWCSYPCRFVLGGRTIYPQTKTQGNKPDEGKRVFIALISIILFPIAIASTASLLLKLATFPCLWEKRKIEKLPYKKPKTAQKVDNTYKNYLLGSQKPKAIKKTVEEIETMIRNDAPWSQVAKEIHAGNGYYTHLINLAVETRLSRELKSGIHQTTSEQIKQFVGNACGYESGFASTQESCYKAILRNALSIDTDKEKHPFTWLVKLELAHLLIFHIEFLRKCTDPTRALSKDSSLRELVFKRSQNYGMLPQLFNSTKEMNMIHIAMEKVRQTSLVKKKLLSVLPALSKANRAHQEVEWNKVQTAILEFQKNLTDLAPYLGKEEQTYIATVQKLTSEFTKCVDAIYAGKPKEEIEAINEGIKESSAKQNQAHNRLCQTVVASLETGDLSALVKVPRGQIKLLLSDMAQIADAALTSHLLKADQEYTAKQSTKNKLTKNKSTR